MYRPIRLRGPSRSFSVYIRRDRVKVNLRSLARGITEVESDNALQMARQSTITLERPRPSGQRLEYFDGKVPIETRLGIIHPITECAAESGVEFIRKVTP